MTICHLSSLQGEHFLLAANAYVTLGQVEMELGTYARAFELCDKSARIRDSFSGTNMTLPAQGERLMWLCTEPIHLYSQTDCTHSRSDCALILCNPLLKNGPQTLLLHLNESRQTATAAGTPTEQPSGRGMSI